MTTAAFQPGGLGAVDRAAEAAPIASPDGGFDLRERALEVWDRIVEVAPTIGAALGALIGLYIVARILRRALIAGLGRTKLDSASASTRLARLLDAIKPGTSPSRALATLVFVFVMLAAWMIALDILGVPVVRDTLRALLAYAPSLASALLIITLGSFVAAAAGRVVTAILHEVRSPLARVLGGLSEILLLVVAVAIALDPLGADTSIITANLTIILGLVLGLLVFLLGWAMRRPAELIIANYYLRRLVAVGDEIDLGGVRGTVVAFAPLGVIVRTGELDAMIPARHVLDGLRRSPHPEPAPPTDGDAAM